MVRKVDPARYAAKRRHILGAAAAVFARKGFEATTTAEICRAAGISSGNLFHYFSSKRDLFVALFRDDRDDTAAHLEAAQAHDDPLEGVLDFVGHLAAPAVEPHIPNLVLEGMLLASRDPDLEEAMGATSDEEQAGIAALLARATEAGVIDPELDVEETAAWIMTLVGAVYLHAATHPDAGTARQLPILRRTVERLLRPAAP